MKIRVYQTVVNTVEVPDSLFPAREVGEDLRNSEQGLVADYLDKNKTWPDIASAMVCDGQTEMVFAEENE